MNSSNSTIPIPGVNSEGDASTDFTGEIGAWIIAAVGSTLGALISILSCGRHLRKYTNPNEQRHIVRIIFIVPIYSVFSWFSLVFHNEALFFDTVRDCYEAYVLYVFLALILAYGGGENECCMRMAVDPGSIRHPWPLCKLPPLALGSHFLRNAKRYTLQFVIMKVSRLFFPRKNVACFF